MHDLIMRLQFSIIVHVHFLTVLNIKKIKFHFQIDYNRYIDIDVIVNNTLIIIYRSA